MRWHLFEFNDQPWLPGRVRNALTAFLEVAYRATPFGRLFATRVAALLERSGADSIVDLCSGSGGPIRLVEAELTKVGLWPKIMLTDLFPHTELALENASYWPEPIDARAVPARLTGMRTMFAAFHHFQPDDAARILRDAFEKRRVIAIFEVTARTPAGIAGAFLIPFGVLLMTPRMRPLTALQLVFTYLVPVLPLMIFWDGLVSQLRTYTPAEMIAMTRELSAPDYQWDCGTIAVPRTPLAVPYLTGQPITS